MQNKELDLPESLGTKKCYECQKEPSDRRFDEIFIVYFGEHRSAPICDDCMDEYSKGGTGDPSAYHLEKI